MNKEIELIIGEVKSKTPDLEKNCPYQIQRAIYLIHDNLFEYHLTINWIKKEGRITDKCFSCIFKKYIGHYPKEYIIRKRLIVAKDLMKNSNLSISMIAIYIGFQSVSAFCNTFKNKEKMNPSEWRNRFK